MDGPVQYLLIQPHCSVLYFIHNARCVEIHRKSPKIHRNAHGKIQFLVARTGILYGYCGCPRMTRQQVGLRFFRRILRKEGTRELPTAVGPRERTAHPSGPTDRNSRYFTKTNIAPNNEDAAATRKVGLSPCAEIAMSSQRKHRSVQAVKR